MLFTVALIQIISEQIDAKVFDNVVVLGSLSISSAWRHACLISTLKLDSYPPLDIAEIRRPS
jgi:hypothetical protein